MIKGGVGEQLKMFMTPDELKSYAEPMDRADIETAEGMWKRKERESKAPEHWGYHGGGVYDSIAKEGVTSHVEVWHDRQGPALSDGHHRVAAAAAVQRDTGRQQFIPIEHEAANASSSWDPLHGYDRRYPQNVRKGWAKGD